MESIKYQLGYRRQPSRFVKIGDLGLGSGSPIRIQSMLSTPTHDVGGCLNEIQALDRAGCEMIRLTVPSMKDLAAMPEIRRLMREEGIARPLIADVHFSPRLAVDACEFFEKVRINPGNYSDRPKSTGGKETGLSFNDGHEKLREAIGPLVANLKKYHRALRIGVNQGSLSTRMIERYGDSPQGMVASALEMVDLFEDQGFDQLVVSLKSSNPIIVQKAYRLLLEEQTGGNPVALHLGVTEAGNEMMGRIKSLVGIGVLLADGIGDTIRVSLTEPGANEIGFARLLVDAVVNSGMVPEGADGSWERSLDDHRIENRGFTLGGLTLGAQSGLKVGQLADTVLPVSEFPFESDFSYQASADAVFLSGSPKPLFVLTEDCIGKPIPANSERNAGVLVQTGTPLCSLRAMYRELPGQKAGLPIGLMAPHRLSENDLFQEIQLAGALSEGLVDFLLIPEQITSETLTRLLCLLQATRVRMMTTDYIICPSCGRTRFDIQQTAAEIKKHTGHLKGLKIGVMGCIVNGPGEMADADFGYVGSGEGQVDLYFGQNRVRRGIRESEAVEKLIELIKEKGRWQ
ncbi:MAG: (E)-4-hydroxy-3-methylbut-2-enyl-diphosphate synthase [bacterium]